MLGMAALLLALAGCGPGDAGNAAGTAAATAAAIAPGAEETVQAVASDPTVEAVANEAAATLEAALADPTVQSAIDEAFKGMNDRVTLQQGQALGLGALSGLSDVQNYKMTLIDAPEAAAASEGKVIKEASGGNISLNPDEYSKYFTTAGDYKVRLDVTASGNKTATHEFTVTVP